jgi:hypothetical protein
MKKNTTGGQRVALDSHLETELAAHLAAVLAHPHTPTRLYNAITDEIASMLSQVPASESLDSAETIERVLNWH